MFDDDDLFIIGSALDETDYAGSGPHDVTVDIELVEDPEPTTHFGSSDEWVRKFLLPSYHRRVTAKGQSGGARWAAAWWESTEAMQRIEALWRMWENLRDDPGELSAWWISHLDAHMNVLLAAGGPFADSTDENRPGEELPYRRPPPSMFGPDLQP